MNGMGVHSIRDVVAPMPRDGRSGASTQLSDGSWGFAVCEPFYGNRFSAAWAVLTGKAYAFDWPTSEEFNRALGWRPNFDGASE